MRSAERPATMTENVTDRAVDNIRHRTYSAGLAREQPTQHDDAENGEETHG